YDRLIVDDQHSHVVASRSMRSAHAGSAKNAMTRSSSRATCATRSEPFSVWPSWAASSSASAAVCSWVAPRIAAEPFRLCATCSTCWTSDAINAARIACSRLGPSSTKIVTSSESRRRSPPSQRMATARSTGRSAAWSMASHLRQVFAYGHRPGEVADRCGRELGGHRSWHQVRDHELLRAGRARHAADVGRLRVIGGKVLDLFFQRRPAATRIPRRLGHLAALVDQAVDAVAPAHEVFARACIARDDDRPAAAVEAEAEGRLDRIVLDQERAHPNGPGVEDLSLLDLGDAHHRRPPIVHVRATHLDVPVEIVEQLVDLSLRAGRAPDLERSVLAGDPPRDQQVAEVDRVVRVVMRDEEGRPLHGAHAGLDQLGADAGAGIDEKSRVAEREERRGAPSLRVGRWTSRAEQNRAHLASDTSMGAERLRSVQNSPTTLPFASISTPSAPGTFGRPGMVRMSPA